MQDNHGQDWQNRKRPDSDQNTMHVVKMNLNSEPANVAQWVERRSHEHNVWARYRLWVRNPG